VTEEAFRIHPPVKIQFPQACVSRRQVPSTRAIPGCRRFKQVTADLYQVGIAYTTRPYLVRNGMLGRQAADQQVNHLPVTLLDGDDAATQLVRDPPGRLRDGWTYGVAHGGFAKGLVLRGMTAGARRDHLGPARACKAESYYNSPAEACQWSTQLRFSTPI
jgi:hypothetical protein